MRPKKHHFSTADNTVQQNMEPIADLINIASNMCCNERRPNMAVLGSPLELRVDCDLRDAIFVF
jgi:hypothetical protein